jgi:general stress protein YciG
MADGNRSSTRGFGSMDPDRHREVSRRGGQISRGGGFAANPTLAREAGRKGGLAGSSRIENRGEH